MTQEEVLRVLGNPSRTATGATGAGDKPCPRWIYRRWYVARFTDYLVDFDFIGPGGTPVVFRTERDDGEPFFDSWARAKST